ncbi:MAG TPA: hypothetical protein VNM45_10415 [Bacillus sp. (in: firmicutes)]|nr:hypothetical protein [Bacillus sp. (in: firmicutes)]
MDPRKECLTHPHSNSECAAIEWNEQESEETLAMNEQQSRSRHLVDQEIIRAIDLFPTSDLTESTLMESRENSAKMLPQTDITQLFPVTFEERAVPSYFGGPDIRTAQAPVYPPTYISIGSLICS